MSKTLNQCLVASENMQWDLLYPKSAQEADKYSNEYINRRERSEKEWAASGFAHLAPSEEKSSPTLPTKNNPQEHSPNPVKRTFQEKLDSASKRRYVDAEQYLLTV